VGCGVRRPVCLYGLDIPDFLAPRVIGNSSG